ncbi:hypothetical protein B0H19DRAFT_963261 [Mycena capillaripes]|nr:hypothetical protein B0H19DRAFT_963261 [Mycena capillaripes]
MSIHQRTQGYVPGAWGSVLPPVVPAFSTFVLAPTSTTTSVPTATSSAVHPPVASRIAAESSTHKLQSHPSSPQLRTVVLPEATVPRFLSVATANTARNLETCGLLLGKEAGHLSSHYVVETLLVPKQHATSDTCSMDEEQSIIAFSEPRGLITLGWIHTHPSQSCFMSSVDLHTHAGFQQMLPEAIAIVCAPKAEPSFGIFRLTDPPGLHTVLECTAKESFHPHPDVPMYTDADTGHVRMRDDVPLEVVDLR